MRLGGATARPVAGFFSIYLGLLAPAAHNEIEAGTARPIGAASFPKPSDAIRPPSWITTSAKQKVVIGTLQSARAKSRRLTRKFPGSEARRPGVTLMPPA